MTDGWKARLQPLREQAGAAWRARSARDRIALTVIALVLGAFLVWVLFVAPAVATLRSAPEQLEAQRLHRRLSIGPGLRRRGQRGLEIRIAHAAGSRTQVVGGAAHLHRGVDDGAHLRVRRLQQRHHRLLAPLNLAALVQRPQVDADDVQHRQGQHTDARRTPRRAPDALPGLAQPARATRMRCEVELAQVPQRAHGLQRMVGVAAHRHRHTEPALGLCRDRG